jgi:dynein heavy chain
LLLSHYRLYAAELLRQWFDQGGWYDRKDKDLSFRKIIDITFVASMGPPGGGRQIITPRFLRHFNIIGYVEMSDSSKSLIFGSILRHFLSPFDAGMKAFRSVIAITSVMPLTFAYILPTAKNFINF